MTRDRLSMSIAAGALGVALLASVGFRIQLPDVPPPSATMPCPFVELTCQQAVIHTIAIYCVDLLTVEFLAACHGKPPFPLFADSFETFSEKWAEFHYGDEPETCEP